jgi:hypothetical protein
MNTFSITFIANQQQTLNHDLHQCGAVTFGAFRERFWAPLMFWTPADYVTQWNEGIHRLLIGYPSSCLFTSMYNPSQANFLTWWILYRDHTTIFIYQQLLMLGELAQPFELLNMYASIPAKPDPVNEDGERISEWCVDVASIQDFYQNPYWWVDDVSL